MTLACEDPRCARERGHHGACASRWGVAPDSTGARWWGTKTSRHAAGCEGCRAEDRAEAARLAAGGALRPGQRRIAPTTSPDARPASLFG